MNSDNYSLSVLRRLEAESIYILREVAAEFARPVMNSNARYQTDRSV